MDPKENEAAWDAAAATATIRTQDEIIGELKQQIADLQDVIRTDALLWERIGELVKARGPITLDWWEATPKTAAHSEADSDWSGLANRTAETPQDALRLLVEQWEQVSEQDERQREVEAEGRWEDTRSRGERLDDEIERLERNGIGRDVL